MDGEVEVMQLRPYQTRAIELVRDSYLSGKRAPILVLPTGSGKTVIAAQIIRQATDKDRRVLFLAPRRELVYQTAEKLHRFGVDAGLVMAGEDSRPWMLAQVGSIDTVVARQKGGKAIRHTPDLVIVDEAHLGISPVRKKMLDEWPDALRLGLTATPTRKDGKALGTLYDDLLVPVTVAELTEAGHLCPARYYSISEPDLSRVKVTAGDYNLKQLDAAVAPLVGNVVETWLARAGGRRTVVFAVSIAHSAALCQEFARNGVAAEHVDAKTPLEERAGIFGRFRDGTTQVLTNCFLAAYGFDAPEISCVVLARPTRSLMMYCMDDETEILTSHGWRGIGQVSEGDCVASCDGPDVKRGRWSRVTGVVERPMSPDEEWVEYNAPRANFRVTDQHRLIAAPMNEKKSGRKLRFVRAIDAAGFKGGAKVPTAVHIAGPGVPLSDDELYFIGMMMADGTWGPARGMIAQSERYPEIIERIEGVLKRLGIYYSKKRQKLGGGYVERYTRWCFNFSAGKPRSNARAQGGRTGFRYLMPYMDKDLSPALMQMSRSQLHTLIGAIWDGDGTKNVGADYTPRSLEICSSRRTMVDRLQALCAIHGMTANMREEQGQRKRPIYYITITDKDWRSCGGYSSKGRGKRPQIELKPPTEEAVWCVETEAGTIVTRRRGKVTVMGNCQMLGRGLRPADGSADCLVLDHSGAVHEHGFAADEREWTLDGDYALTSGPKRKRKPGEGKLVDCPECRAVYSGRRDCPECGYVRPVKGVEIETLDGELVEIGSEMGEERADQMRWYLELVGLAEERGWKRGAAAWRYKEKFGAWPPRAWNRKPAARPSPETRRWVQSRIIAWRKAKAKQEATA